ncbi:MAG: asparagine synthase-related protein [Candidatus Pelagibacter sp.]
MIECFSQMLLKSRFPFMDRILFEYMAKIPPNMRIERDNKKKAYRKISNERFST